MTLSGVKNPKLRRARDLGRELTSHEKLENLDWHMMHCHRCGVECKWGAPVCEVCGEELMEHGKH